VRGTVGNRVMSPALEALGFEVWQVPTILLPFHPGQGRGTRSVPEDEAFRGCLADLYARDDTHRVKAVVSGYLGSANQAAAIGHFIDALRGKSEFIYCCDPVMGDDGGLYVAQEVAHAIVRHLVPRADICTPNRAEHDWLADNRLPTNHAPSSSTRGGGAAIQVITSAHSDRAGALAVAAYRGDSLLMRINHERYDIVPNGTGDLFAAVLTGLLASGNALDDALCGATGKVVCSAAMSPRNRTGDLVIAKDVDPRQAALHIEHMQPDSEKQS